MLTTAHIHTGCGFMVTTQVKMLTNNEIPAFPIELQQLLLLSDYYVQHC